MLPVLLIRNDRDDTLGIAPAVLAEEGLPVRRLDAFAAAAWPEVGAIGGLMVFGGEMNVDETDQYGFLSFERDLIRRCIALDVPVLGICLGAQLLARAAGARVTPSPVRELGFRPVRITAAGAEDPLLQAFADGDQVFQWHEDMVELPDEATLLALGDDVRVQAFRLGRRAWGVQFHFEIDRQGMEAWLLAAGSGLEAAWQRTAGKVRAELGEYLPAQQRRARQLLTAFGHEVRRAGGL
jgi:GMP synthase (glutamine-hydrolysing)